jgi:hypothetical protein
MKNKWIKIAGAVVAAVAVAANVQATPIAGSIGFTGTYTANGTFDDLTTATSMTITSVAIASETGVFATATTPTFKSPIAVNPANNLIPSVQLWTVLVGGVTYSMVVNTEVETLDTSSQLNLAGTGTLEDGTAADNTAGTWQLGFGANGNSFTWQSTSGNNVPDGGTTAMLLGGTLMGLGLIKRKLMA